MGGRDGIDPIPWKQHVPSQAKMCSKKCIIIKFIYFDFLPHLSTATGHVKYSQTYRRYNKAR